jgi:hypothetical protein
MSAYACLLLGEKNMKHDKKYTKSGFMKSKFMESMILGASGLIAISVAGFIVYATGKTFDLAFLSTPFIDEALMMIKFPLFFVIASLIKIIIGGKLIEFSVKYISRLLGIKKIIIDPEKPLIIVKKED